ncbi:MAG: XylR family transcriptional regulator [Kiritimatiellae bacterium]|jgi:LacI family transcriptional regulator|nr:XylR family transcriptional regulator [Kiritimatiellia bacterium]
MAKFLQKIPHVLVALSTVQKARRDKLQGVLRYAQLNGPWDVQMLEDHPYIAKLGSFRNWHPDGIIRDGMDSLPLPGMRTAKIPTVLIDTQVPPPRGKSCVNNDPSLIAGTVAEYYLRQGLKQFAYVGSVPESSWSRARAEAFALRIKEKGCACNLYKPQHANDWGLEQKHMRAWLKELPKPCGLMAAMDRRAKQVLDTCALAEIRVPEEISVIGVDNDETICERTTPTLSSVLPDFEGGGYIAAELLDSLMRSVNPRVIQQTYDVKRIVHRLSSQDMKNSSRLTISAMEFIRLNACAGITVMDVVQHLNVSRRFAELRFREARGHSILEEIQQKRLERVRTLLRETSLPIAEVGERCGYPTETYLKTLFKKRFEMTMRDYRKKH